MGDSACLMHGHFSYAPAMPNEAKLGNPMHGLGESISLGRFMSESLSWEKWSSFSSHKRYVEEAKSYAQPGSVAQKKAFFEDHYKRIAAQKATAVALVDQESAANNDKDSEDHANDLPVADERWDEVKKPVGEKDLGLNACEYGSIAESNEVETRKDGENGVIVASGETPMRENSSNKVYNAENQEPASGSETSGTPQMEKPLLKHQNPDQREDNPSVTSKNKSALSSFKSSIHRKTSKVPFTPAKPITPHFKKEHNVMRKANVDSMDKNKSFQKSLINMLPAKEPDKVPILWNERTETSGVPPISSKTRKHCATPLKTPTGAAKYGVSNYNAETPPSEDRRNKAPVDPSALRSRTSGPKWHILSAVCPKSLTAYRNKLQSPTLSTPFILRTEERAARRKQKLEEKFNAKEAPKAQLQTKLREKAGNEFRKLGQSFCFKARPLPDFYKERQMQNQMKRSSVSQPTPMGKTYSIKKQGTVSMPPTSPPPTFLAKKNATSKNASKKKIVIPANFLTSKPERLNHENKSPNIQQ